MDVPRHRQHARDALGLRSSRLGRLLGVGPRRKRGLHAVSDGERLRALDDDPGAARPAQGVERLSRRAHLLPHHLRHVPHALRDDRQRPRVRSVVHRLLLRRLPRHARRGLHHARTLALAGAARRSPRAEAALGGGRLGMDRGPRVPARRLLHVEAAHAGRAPGDSHRGGRRSCSLRGARDRVPQDDPRVGPASAKAPDRVTLFA